MAVAVTVPWFGRFSLGTFHQESVASPQVTATTAASNALSGQSTSEAMTGAPWQHSREPMDRCKGRCRRHQGPVIEKPRMELTTVASNHGQRWDINARFGVKATPSELQLSLHSLHSLHAAAGAAAGYDATTYPNSGSIAAGHFLVLCKAFLETDETASISFNTPGDDPEPCQVWVTTTFAVTHTTPMISTTPPPYGASPRIPASSGRPARPWVSLLRLLSM